MICTITDIIQPVAQEVMDKLLRTLTAMSSSGRAFTMPSSFCGSFEEKNPDILDSDVLTEVLLVFRSEIKSLPTPVLQRIRDFSKVVARYLTIDWVGNQQDMLVVQVASLLFSQGKYSDGQTHIFVSI